MIPIDYSDRKVETHTLKPLTSHLQVFSKPQQVDGGRYDNKPNVSVIARYLFSSRQRFS
jgi:hypothetical protein